jgi:putative thioredoxin
MTNQNNPYGDSSYSVTTQFGNGAAVDAPAAADLIKDTTTAAFANDVIKESRNQPVLVDFWAPWCGPCKQLTPALEKAVRTANGKVKLVKMNIDEHPSIAGQLGIQSIPAVIAFKNGQPVDGFMGAVPETQIEAFIKRLGGGDSGKQQIADALAAAKEALAAGDAVGAIQIYEAILQQAPETVEAIAALADLHFEAGDLEAAQTVLATAPEQKANAPEIVAVKAKITLAEQTADLGDATELERRLVADPKDHEARFDLAMIQNARGERDAAAHNLLAIVKADRTWKDDGARAQLLKLFEAWGPMDDATLAARRKLSSLLFS